jgi:hypothetical protein
MPQFRITRRTVLRGAGVGLALPPLEIMSRPGTAAAAASPRYVVCFAGTSTGGLGKTTEIVAPTAVGPNFQPTAPLTPLATRGLLADVGIVSGLKVPWNASGAVPPGGRAVSFHGSSMVPQVTGLRSLAHDQNASGPSSDQIVADGLGVLAPPRSLVLRVQPTSYRPTAAVRGRMSWDNKGRPIDPVVSPRNVFDSLFGALQAPADPAAAKAAQIAAQTRKSVLDLVLDSGTRLRTRLGQQDKMRLDKHLEDLRAFETSLTLSPDAASCKAPATPGADAPAGAAYSDEDARAQLLCDLLGTALVCNVTRVAAVQLTFVQCFMMMGTITGIQKDMHDLNHSATLAQLAEGLKWHVDVFARLVARLKAPEVDGTTVLDHSALVMLFEGGHGYDPEGARPNNSHSTENMVVLYAGRAGGMKPGQHILARDKHPAQVVLTAMNAVGVKKPALGEVAGLIPEMGVG